MYYFKIGISLLMTGNNCWEVFFIILGISLDNNKVIAMGDAGRKLGFLYRHKCPLSSPLGLEVKNCQN